MWDGAMARERAQTNGEVLLSQVTSALVMIEVSWRTSLSRVRVGMERGWRIVQHWADSSLCSRNFVERSEEAERGRNLPCSFLSLTCVLQSRFRRLDQTTDWAFADAALASVTHDYSRHERKWSSYWQLPNLNGVPGSSNRDTDNSRVLFQVQIEQTFMVGNVFGMHRFWDSCTIENVVGVLSKQITR